MSRTHTQVIYNRLNHLPTPDELKYRQGKATVTAPQTTPANADIVDSLVEAVNTTGNPTPISHTVSNPSDGKLVQHDQLYTKQVRNRWTREIIGTYDRVYNWTKRSITYLLRETLTVDGVRYDLNPDVGTLNGRPSDTSDGTGPVNRSKTIHFPFDVEVYDPDQPGDMLGPAIDYTVTFVTWDGQVISSQLVKPGASAVAPAPPVRPGNTFVGWSEDYVNVQRDMVIRPIYSNDEMTVTWLNWDGSVMKTETVRFSQSATPPPEPSRVGHVFSGWDVDYTYIMADTVITATFSPNIMIVTFLDWDGLELGASEVPYGDEAARIIDPVRENYTFIGWDKDLSAVTEDIVTTAQYEINRFNVIFYDTLVNKVISTIQVEYEQPATPPAFPWYHQAIPEGAEADEIAAIEAANAAADQFYAAYDFIGWTENLDQIYDHCVAEAVFDLKMVKIKLIDGTNLEVFKEYEVPYGSQFTGDFTLPDHSDIGLEFGGWEALHGAEMTILTEDTEILAKYQTMWVRLIYFSEHGAMKTPPEVYFDDSLLYGNTLAEAGTWPPDIVSEDGSMTLDSWYYPNKLTGRLEPLTLDTVILGDTLCYPRFRPIDSIVVEPDPDPQP